MNTRPFLIGLLLTCYSALVDVIGYRVRERRCQSWRSPARAASWHRFHRCGGTKGARCLRAHALSQWMSNMAHRFAKSA